ncbi:DUF3450 family protein [Halomonas sp. HK25]|uniref:DUF3450 family protein n=1 Tax=Halomonas sp. HK25 TaxID=3394321 RepID=UPI0039FCDDCE
MNERRRVSTASRWVGAACLCLSLLMTSGMASAQSPEDTGPALEPGALGLALPLAAEMARSLEALEAFISGDLPFLAEQRRARVVDLREALAADPLLAHEQWQALVSAWRQELAYGREIDSWRGLLLGDASREVDYLRLGRVGLYFLTPDGREGGVWSLIEAGWLPLEGAELAELRKGLAIARERRAPELLTLPVSLAPHVDDAGATPQPPLPMAVGVDGGVDVELLERVGRQVGELRDGLSESWLRLGSGLEPPARPGGEMSGIEAGAALLRGLEAWTEESGRWRRFEAPVADVTGRITTREVARLGDLLAFGGGDLLRRGAFENGETPRLAVVEGLSTEQRARLAGAWSGQGALLLDPTSGRLLDALSAQPSLVERFHQGGAVGYVVVTLGGLGLLAALIQYAYLLGVSLRLRRQLRNPEALNHDNPLGRVLGRFATLSDGLPPEALEARLDEALLAELPRLERGQGLVKLLAAVAPLLGLLGTVTGMIVTFQAITVFGTGDPQLMAGGISQALVTTVLGLITAVPLLFAHTALVSRSRGLVGLLEGHASAALAEHLEARSVPLNAPSRESHALST